MSERVKVRDFLAPHLEQPLSQIDDDLSLQTVCAMSMAFSAKRQADALEAIADRLRDLSQSDMFHPEWGLAPQLGQIARKVGK